MESKKLGVGGCIVHKGKSGLCEQRERAVERTNRRPREADRNGVDLSIAQTERRRNRAWQRDELKLRREERERERERRRRKKGKRIREREREREKGERAGMSCPEQKETEKRREKRKEECRIQQKR